MDRVREILKYVRKSDEGIEVSPYHSPLVSRSNGYRSISLDIFDAAELRRRAAAEPGIPDAHVGRIEEVDLQGSAVDIAELVAARFGGKRFDYVVSSHNLEHLPDPIRFLQGCEKVLTDGGVLSLAVPDRRYCFDFFRPVTELSEWLDAFHEKRKRPTAGQIFRGESLRSNLDGSGAWHPLLAIIPTPEENVESAYADWRSSMQDGAIPEYIDIHCSAFTPASLELMLADLRFLGLIHFETLEISRPNGCEFYVHLRHSGGGCAVDDPVAHYRERARIMRRAATEAGQNPSIRTRILRAGLLPILKAGEKLRARGVAFQDRHGSRVITGTTTDSGNCLRSGR